MSLSKKLIHLLVCLLALASSSQLLVLAAPEGKKSKTEATSSNDKSKAQADQTVANKRAEKIVPVDINSASKEELMKVAGIGTRYSDEIIKGRPYKTKSQLLSRKILPAAVYKAVADKIIARQK